MYRTHIKSYNNNMWCNIEYVWNVYLNDFVCGIGHGLAEVSK